MKDIIYMNEDEVLELIVESVKTLKKYRESMKKSSESRMNAFLEWRFQSLVAEQFF